MSTWPPEAAMVLDEHVRADLLALSEAADKEQGFIQLSNSSIACAVSRMLDTELFKKTDC